MLSGPSFRVAGIPVRIDLTFLMMAFLLGWGARTGGLLLAWMVIVTASVLLHELGHAFAFRRFGQEPQILLQGLGGLTSTFSRSFPSTAAASRLHSSPCAPQTVPVRPIWSQRSWPRQAPWWPF